MPYKDLERRKEYQREYPQEWRTNNPEKWKQIQNKAEQKESRKEYRKRWWNESPRAKMIKERFKQIHPEIQKDYDKSFKQKNPERVRIKYEKYASSVKGIINRLKKADNKRFNLTNTELSYDLITSLDIKFKVCPYCGGEFKPRFDYDHINPFKPFSKFNILKVCSKCNQSKNNANLLDWAKFKGYNLSNEVIELYNNSRQ